MIGPVLFNSKLLLASSDLSGIKVTRRDPVTGEKREWVVDCSSEKPAADLWLRDGGVIKVPEMLIDRWLHHRRQCTKPRICRVNYGQALG